MLFSLLNINSFNDTKQIFLQNISSKYHIQFFTEINIENVEQENTLLSDDFYEWVLIPKNTEFSQRIGLRYPSNLQNKIKVNILDHKYVAQPVRSANQKDKSVVQLLHVSINIYHAFFKVVLIYRTPDANAESTSRMYSYLDAQAPILRLAT